MSDQEYEVAYLRERLKELEALLELSYCLVFLPHKDVLKRKENLEKFKIKLAEYGIGGGDLDGKRNTN